MTTGDIALVATGSTTVEVQYNGITVYVTITTT